MKFETVILWLAAATIVALNFTCWQGLRNFNRTSEDVRLLRSEIVKLKAKVETHSCCASAALYNMHLSDGNPLQKVICPECQRLGMTSTVMQEMTTSTAMFVAVTYDEDGRMMTHDPNTIATEYSCSRGHRFTHMNK